MQIYSNTLQTFTKRLLIDLKDIISNEVGLTVRKSRFEYDRMLYPLSIVCFEHQTKLGFFDHKILQIGINKNLMYTTKRKILKDILRHEFAHYLTYIQHGADLPPHGKRFKETCTNLGWENSVSKASINLEFENSKLEGDLKSEKIIEKIKKLMKLASSDNHHEAELATLKANQLLLKYNLENVHEDTEMTSHLCHVLSGKRVSGKHHAIYEILTTFFVSPIFNYGKGHYYLDIVGEKTNVTLAEYVAHYLDRELETIWKNYQHSHDKLKGLAAKNAFFKGLAQGYIQKIKKSQDDSMGTNELIKVKFDLEKRVELAFPRLSSVKRSTSNLHSHSKNLGKEAGKKLSINPAISNKKKSARGLLSFF
jgi:hypothetical protein